MTLAADLAPELTAVQKVVARCGDDLGVSLDGLPHCRFLNAENLSPHRWSGLLSEAHPQETAILDSSMEGHIVDVERLAEAAGGWRRVVLLTTNHAALRDIAALGEDRLRGVYFHYFHAYLVASAVRVAPTRAARQKRWADRFPMRERTWERRYSCLINRARPHRLAIFGWLKRNGLLDRGAVSFHGAEFLAEPARLAAAAEQAHATFPSFCEEIDTALTSDLPYQNFPATAQENLVVSFGVPAYTLAPFSLVAESEMSWGERDRITEKALKPLIAGHLMLVAGNPGALALLRRMGFQTWKPIIDEAYDSIANPDLRLRAVMDQFARLMDLSEPEWRDLLREGWIATGFNLNEFVEIGREQVARWVADLREAIA